jgi:CubicO group peptidase (beta-lactamase class C family)
MGHSTFVQPLPAELAPFMSSGYRLASDEAQSFEIVNPFPAGSLSSSATDMAQFMIAHLQDGQFNGASILKPETARLMHSRLFGLDDAANAMCYGFYEESRSGHRIIGHAGDTVSFHSDLHLVLDQKLGFFVSYNSPGRGDGSGRVNLWHAFLDRYYPYNAPLLVLQPLKKMLKLPRHLFVKSAQREFVLESGNVAWTVHVCHLLGMAI